MKQFVFGVTNDGYRASKFVLENKNGMNIEVSDFGALVLGISLLDKKGERRDVVLGFDKIEDYYNTETGFGAYVGRNANRIQGARVEIEGVEYLLDINDNGNNLHSGYDRSHCKVYKWNVVGKEESIEFSRISPHMEQGFPGNLKQKIRYSLTEENEFVIDYEMESDRTTVVNPTNHTYFNLDGHDSGTVLQQELEIFSDEFLNTDSELIPTGEIVNVTDTPMDFRNRKKIGAEIDSGYQPLWLAKGYDHNYIFPNDRCLRKMARMYGTESGIVMTVYSDLCGLQVYSGNFLNGQCGKAGAVYERRSGICFETQFYPNSCKEHRFPSCILEAGKVFRSRTIYHFIN